MKLCLKCGSVGELSNKYGIVPLGETTNDNVSLCKNLHNDSIIDTNLDFEKFIASEILN